MNDRSRWLLAFAGSYRRSIVLALAFGFVSAGCGALLMFTSGFLISATAQEGITLFSIMIPIAFVQLFGFGRPAAHYIERLISHNWVLKVTSDLRRRLFGRVASDEVESVSAAPSGKYLSLLADDIAHLQNLFLRVVFPTAIALLLAVGAVVAFGLFSWPFAGIMLIVFAGTTIGLPLATLALTRTRALEAKQSRAQAYEDLTDDVLGATDWMLSGRGGEAIAANVQRARSFRDGQQRNRTIERAVELASTLCLAAALCAVIAWSGGRFGTDASLANWIAAFALGFFPLIESFAVMPGVVASSTGYRDAVTRLHDGTEGPASPCDRTVLEVEQGPAPIEVRGVRYGYPGAARPALDGIDLSIGAGQHVAVLGKSGSGKSTLAAVIRGALRPTTGYALLGGVDVSASRYDTSHVVSFLSQDPYVFNKPLRDNLSMGLDDVSDDEMIAALQAVGLGERFAQLESGLDTVAGETGMGFSGGESHRIALARVLLRHTGAVIVDEPFAALDPETERDLLDTLLGTCKDRTLVVITHHLAEIERFDRVVFIENGRIDLDGSPADLKAESPRFRNLLAFDRGE